jgi:hypothetical protein
MSTDVELPAFRASLRVGLPLVVVAVTDFVPDDGAARQAFTELRPVDKESLVQRGGVVISRRLRLTANVQSQFESPCGQCVRRPPPGTKGRPVNYSDADYADVDSR